jgi:putative peptidoglycan lipid II flippase
LIPVYSEELHNNPERAAELANTVLTVVFVILAAIVVVGEVLLGAGYGFVASRTGPRVGLLLCAIMLPYMIMICISALLAGVQNVHRHFATPAIGPIILNGFIIGGILFSAKLLKVEPQRQVFWVAVSVLLSGIVQIAIQLPSLRARGISIRPAWQVHSEAFRKTILLMGPMVLGLAVTQLNTLLDDVIALCFMTKEGYPLSIGAPSHLYYAQRLYQLPLGVLGISLATAIFPIMSADAVRKDFAALTATIARGIRGAVFVAIPATAGTFLVAKPAICAIFEHGKFRSEDTSAVTWTLSFYAVGLTGYFLQQLTTRAFYAVQDSKTPALSAVAAVGANLVLNLTLIWVLGTGGLALATALCSYLQVTVLLRVLHKRLGRSVLEGLSATVVKTVAATAAMLVAGLAVLVLMRDMQPGRLSQVIKLAVLVPTTVSVYLLAAKFLRIEMLALLTRGAPREEHVAGAEG